MKTPLQLARSTATVALAAAALLACASPITVQFDPDEDFGALRSFAWYPSRTPAQTMKRQRFPSQFDAAERAAEAHLLEKGFQKASREAADFLVLVQLSLERRFTTRIINEPYRMGGSEWEVHQVVTREETVEYQRGTVVVDVLDARSRRLVWRGTTSGTLEIDEVPRPDRVAERVTAILAQFPPSG